MDSECHAMVIEYLMHNCFKNTAKAFIDENTKLENCASVIQKGNMKKSNNCPLRFIFTPEE